MELTESPRPHVSNSGPGGSVIILAHCEFELTVDTLALDPGCETHFHPGPTSASTVPLEGPVLNETPYRSRVHNPWSADQY